AQRNLVANGNPTVGETLQIFPKLGLGGNLGNANIRNLIRQGQVGELVSTYVSSRNTFLRPGVNGSTLSPAFFLPANPNAFVTDYIGNYSFSNYNAVQAEIRKRLRYGVYLQANYTYSKAFTDFDGSQSNFSGLLDLANGGALEKRRSSQDVTHIFKANGVYELPFGRDKRFLNGGGVINKILGGFEISPILEVRSGRPISILSTRGTVNRSGRSGRNTAVTTLSVSDLQSKTGVFRDSEGNLLLFDPSLIGSDGRANTQSFQNPTAGQFGALQQTPVSGPGYFNVDAALIKRTAITERLKVEFRGELFNAFNNVNFNVGEDQNINSTTFGVISDTFDPRILQFSLKLIF
ncbi:MAG TPA: hypothetical protein VE715_18160, partial [Blastocatellia bacterium]|nr:hypothetical protein [Blastocatellia bacterium]